MIRPNCLVIKASVSFIQSKLQGMNYWAVFNHLSVLNLCFYYAFAFQFYLSSSLDTVAKTFQRGEIFFIFSIIQ